MKKYIIGLFSAICLMGAGCTEFEDYEPVDMGEGPSVTVALEKTAIDAFNLTVTPGEGTVYYAYIVTNEAMSLDAETLLETDYEGAVLLKASETPSVAKSFTNQEIGTTYYVYAVASNDKGLCGAIASATLELADAEAPYLVSVPDGYLYKATNNGRSVTLTFNETVIRGEGAITYNVTKGDLTSYASGAIESVVINGESVIISLPETVAFDENEAKSYVFLDFAAGAFVDAAGNQSAALVGGVDEETQVVGAPYWEYVSGGSTGGDGIVIEIDENEGVGMYAFIATSVDPDYPNYADAILVYPGDKVAELTGEAFDSEYGFMGFGYCYADDASQYAVFPGDISDDGSTLNVGTSLKSDGMFYPACDIPTETGSRTTFYFAIGTYNESTNEVSLTKELTIPFVADATEPLKLNTDKVILCMIPKTETTLSVIDVLFDPYLIPVRLLESASVAQSFTPSLNRQMKANAIKAQVNSMMDIPVQSILRKLR